MNKYHEADRNALAFKEKVIEEVQRQRDELQAKLGTATGMKETYYDCWKAVFDKCCLMGMNLDGCGTGIENVLNFIDEYRWRNVSEELPEKNGLYLAGDKTTVGEAYWTGENGNGKWKFLGTTCIFVFDKSIVKTDRFPTHWMPIPQLPEEVSNE